MMSQFDVRGEDPRKQRFAEAQKRKQKLKERMEKIDHKIAVMSGKGGVGKSTVSVNLAVALAEDGFRVGLLDLDLHGPNVVRMLGVKDTLSAEAGDIIPAVFGDGLKVVSMDFLLDEGAPVIWRGPIKVTAVEQLLGDVDWGELDFLIVDLPPGTGDEALTLYQSVDVDGSVIVTTPQVVSIDDVRRAMRFVLEMRKAPLSASRNARILGIVENMSYLRCPNGDVVRPFGEGGADALAEEFDVPILARIPLDPKAVEMMDRGMPPVAFYRGSEFEKAFRDMVEKLLDVLKGE